MTTVFKIHKSSDFSVGVAPPIRSVLVPAGTIVYGAGPVAETQSWDMAGVFLTFLAAILCFSYRIWLSTALTPMVPSLKVLLHRMHLASSGLARDVSQI